MLTAIEYILNPDGRAVMGVVSTVHPAEALVEMSQFNEPWHLSAADCWIEGPVCILRDSSGRITAVFENSFANETDERAARVAACVNACRGIPTEILQTATPHVHLSDNKLTLCCKAEDLPGFLKKFLEKWECEQCSN